MIDPITVSQLSRWLRDHLEDSFPTVAVVGEISTFKRPGSAGHLYFELKDRSDRVNCTCWNSVAERLAFAPKDGLQVVVRGSVTYYGPQAKLQINVQSMEPVGVGAAELAKQQLIEKLRGLGWFDRPRKALPGYPKRVALVTSAAGAAVRDMIQSFKTRWPSCELVLKHSSVQGASAPLELAAGLRELNALHLSGAMRLDAVIVGRGGGSAEDLIAFNTEIVAGAIHASVVPVVSAVGHEIDVTLADLVADCRALTPTAAVTMLTPDPEQIIAEFHRKKKRMQNALHGKCRRAREDLDFIAERPAFARPLDRVRRGEQRLDDLSERLRLSFKRRLQRGEAKLQSLAERLQSLSPLNVLARGYSVTLKDGHVVRDAATLSRGDEIVTKLANGEVASTVL